MSLQMFNHIDFSVLPEWKVRGGAREHNTGLYSEHSDLRTPRQHIQSYAAQSADIRSV